MGMGKAREEPRGEGLQFEDGAIKLIVRSRSKGLGRMIECK